MGREKHTKAAFNTAHSAPVLAQAAELIQPGCTRAVRASFAALRAATPAEAQRALGLCAPSLAADSEFGWDALEFWITQYFATMAMFNYPPSRSPLQANCAFVMGLNRTGAEGEGGSSSIRTPFRVLLSASFHS